MNGQMTIGNIIVLLIVVLIVAMLMYLFKINIAGLGKKVTAPLKNKSKEIKEKNIVKINGPIIKYREEDKSKYDVTVMDTKVFRIGRGEKNNLVFDSLLVEDEHAVIYKRQNENRVYYELVNLGKTNPVEYYNKQKDTYEFLRYKESVELDVRDAFFMGDMKLIITTPVNTHQPTRSDYMDNAEAKKKAQTPPKAEPKEESGSYESKRVKSERIVRRNEVDV